MSADSEFGIGAVGSKWVFTTPCPEDTDRFGMEEFPLCAALQFSQSRAGVPRAGTQRGPSFSRSGLFCDDSGLFCEKS